MDEEVGIRLSLKGRREAASGIDDVGDKLDRAGDEAASLGRKSRASAAGVIALGKSGRFAGRAMLYGFGAASAAIVGAGIVLTKLSKDSIAEAREAQKVGAITRQEIKATGHAAGVSAKKVGDLSSAISAKVGIDDEEIQSGANLLLMYKQVQNQQGKGNKIYDRAVRAAVNMSAVTGTLATNSKLLGKNLNDPMKAITGLTKAGVKWTDEQIKQIEQYEKQGKLLAAQKIVLGAVEERFGGVAAAQATWGEKASVSIGNIKERIGAVLVPQLDRVERWFVTKGTPVVNGWMDSFERRGIPQIEKYAGLFVDKGIPAMHDFLGEARPLAESVLPAIGTALGTTRDVVKELAPKLKSVFDGFNALPDWAKQAIVIGAGGAAVAKKLGVGSLLSAGAGGVISRAAPLPVLVTNPGFGAPGPGSSPIVPTGTPRGTPPVVPLSGLPKWASKFGGLGLGGLFTAVTLADRHPEGGWGTPIDPSKVQTTEQEFWDMVNAEHKRSVDALNKLLVGPLGKTAQLRSDWSFLTQNPADPRIKEQGMVGAVSTADGLAGLLGQIDHTVATPRVSIDAGPALAAIRTVNDALVGVTDFFGGSTTSAPSSHNWSNLGDPKHHGGGKKHSGRTRTPKVTGVVVPKAPKLLPVDGGSDLGPGGRGPLVLQVQLDGKTIMESTVEHLQTKAARK